MTILANRAKVYTATTGTGTLTLGSPVASFQSFADAGVADGNSVRYVIEDGINWEIGVGTYSSTGPTLTRAPSESSNAGAAINLSGAALVYVTAGTEELQFAADMDQGVATTDSPSFAGLTATGDLTIADKIVHSGDTNTAVRFPAADTVTVETSGAERMRITSAGNVGIGNSSPTVKLQITDASSPTLMVQDTTNNVQTLVASLDSFGFVGTGTAHDFTIRSSNTERMRITSTGNVGIGTSAPATKLQVSPFPSSGDQGPVAITLGNESNSARGAQITKNTSTPYNFTLTAGLNASVGSATVFETRPGAEAMRIDSAGNVGIGTSSPSVPFHVAKGAAGDEVARFTNAGGFGLKIIPQIGGSGAVTALRVAGGESMSFETNSTERMRIDSAGNVGVGTSSPLGKLDVTGGNLFVKHSTAPDIILRQTSSTIASGTSLGRLLYQGTNAAGTYPFASVEAEVDGNTGANDAPGRLLFKTTPDGSNTLTERMRIDSSGNVGIGTTAPSTKLHINTGANATAITLQASSATAALLQLGVGARTSGVPSVLSTSNGLDLGTTNSTPLYFITGNTERMRIDSSGNLLVGGSSNGSQGALSIRPGSGANIGAPQLYFNRASSTLASFVALFNNAGVVVGGISHTNTSTTYATSSDYRLKEDVQPMVGASERLLALKPVNFAWKADGSRVDGFLAHEAQEVVPEAVVGVKDETDADGNPVYQGIDQSKLVPLLTAALQESLKKIEELEARVAALEGN